MENDAIERWLDPRREILGDGLGRKIFEFFVAWHDWLADLLNEVTEKCRSVGTGREFGVKPTSVASYLRKHIKIENPDGPDELEFAQHDVAAYRRANLGNARISFYRTVKDGYSCRIHATCRAGLRGNERL